MAQGYFITGTDTNVGKTWATVALMRYFKRQGKSVVGMKPVASGCYWENGRLRNLDALLLQENASVRLDYGLVNPYAYQLPVSPHIAGMDNPVDMAYVLGQFDQVKRMADLVLVEGVGGWYAPINSGQTVCDLAKALNLQVIIVIAVRLGCLNHATLTFQAIQQSGLVCAGWIAMCTEPEMLCLEENIQTLTVNISVPLLGVLPYMGQVDFDVLSGRMCL